MTEVTRALFFLLLFLLDETARMADPGRGGVGEGAAAATMATAPEKDPRKGPIRPERDEDRPRGGFTILKNNEQAARLITESRLCTVSHLFCGLVAPGRPRTTWLHANLRAART